MNIYRKINFYCDNCQTDVENPLIRDGNDQKLFHCQDCNRLLEVVDGNQLYIETLYDVFTRKEDK